MTDEEKRAPTTLEEWYDQLVEVAADGNAPSFDWERERIVDLAVRETLQQKLDAECREFAEDVAHLCDHSPQHAPADLFGNLDDCYVCDNDGGTNVPYGGMYALVHLATALGLKVEMNFPDLEPAERQPARKVWRHTGRLEARTTLAHDPEPYARIGDDTRCAECGDVIEEVVN